MLYDLGFYCDFSKVVSDAVYAKTKGIIVKSMTINEKKLYMLNYEKDKITKDNVLGFFRSVITDGKRIVCFSPPKSEKYIDFMKENKYEDVKIENFVEGTMINVFYYKDEWNISTRGNIGANCKYFRDYKKTFRTLFLETMNSSGLEFEMLNKEFCYTFVMQHPENRIVIPFSEEKLILIAMYKCHETMVEDVNMNDNFLKNLDNSVVKIYTPKSIIEFNYDGKNYTDLFEYFSSYNMDYKNMGIVVKNKGLRTKIWNPNYLKVKTLRGNNPKIQYQYYHLLKDKKLNEFLHYYPEYKVLFENYRTELYSWTDQLWKNYRSCYVRKENPLLEYPGVFRQHMFKIHQGYLNNLKPMNKIVDKLYVIKYVNNLDPAQIMFAINFVYRDLKVDEEKKKLAVNSM